MIVSEYLINEKRETRLATCPFSEYQKNFYKQIRIELSYERNATLILLLIEHDKTAKRKIN